MRSRAATLVAAGTGRLPDRRPAEPAGHAGHGDGRLTHLLTIFPTFAAGGAQLRFAAVANHLGRALRHTVVAMDGVTSCRERLDPGLDIRFHAVGIDKGNPLRTVRRLRAELAALAPDLLLTHNWGAIEWGLANRFPRRLVRHIHVEDGFGPEERERQLRRRVIARRVALAGSTVVLPSQVLTAKARDVWRLDPTCLRYIPNGVDLCRFGVPRAGPPPWSLPQPIGPEAPPVVGTVAALRAEKNLGRLLRALAAVPGLRLAIVGDGPERAALLALAGSLGLGDRVAFAGHCADPTTAYGHMDIFALSSDTEQMPLSVLEAMAAGLPVAATDVGDVAVMLAAANRAYVVPREDAALAAALARLGAAPALRRTLGEANRRKATADYDQCRMLAAWSDLLAAKLDMRLPA